jgi:hypothetical protein
LIGVAHNGGSGEIDDLCIAADPESGLVEVEDGDADLL